MTDTPRTDNNLHRGRVVTKGGWVVGNESDEWVPASVARQLERALHSIAANTCCDRCQEAALVAKSALGNTARP